MYSHPKFRLFFITFITLWFSNGALALSNDSEQPIQIEADQASIDNIKGVAIYAGNVIVTQGSIRLNAEKVTLNYTDKHEIEKVVAEGQPVRFKQRLDSGDNIKAQAKEMEYHAVKSMLHLRKAAELRKNKGGINTYISTAPRISYDTEHGIIKADQGNLKKGRVTMTFKPQPKQ
jgi:lipopolysaccharide export system protein LptA